MPFHLRSRSTDRNVHASHSTDLPPAQSSFFTGAHDFRIDYQTINSFSGNQYQIFNVRLEEDLIRRLNPILDASHTRNRKRSPPDSECFPGTRVEPIQEVMAWADSDEVTLQSQPDGQSDVLYQVVHPAVIKTPHIYWLHGFAGCGKSSLSLEIARVYARSGRLLASHFFFRGVEHRSTLNRFAATLASQMLAVLPATAPFIEKSVSKDPGLLTGDVSFGRQVKKLILAPFQRALKRDALEESLAKGPFLIVIDGLDECEDKPGVEEVIGYLLHFFDRHPTIPLRIFIASRVEQHIRERLEVPEVQMADLDTHSPREDIAKFLDAAFQAAAKHDRLLRAYIRVHGSWPAASDRHKLLEHIGGSFVLASTLLKFIIQPATEDDPTTPMERVPLALGMNGLDNLYSEILARSQHLLHFHDVISTLALLRFPLPVAKIAGLLKIETFEILRVLLNLQAIIHVPGTDEKGEVTLCHTSLRDFLTAESRSGIFFVPPSFHLHLSYYHWSSSFDISKEGADELYTTRTYNFGGIPHFEYHWLFFANSSSCDLLNGIEDFKAHQSSRFDEVPYHPFLCSMSFYFLVHYSSQTPCIFSYLLAQCAKHLVLAAECLEPRIRLWLEKDLSMVYAPRSRFLHVVSFTEGDSEAVRYDLQRAENAIHSQFPDVLERPSGAMVATINRHYLSGRDILNILQWIIARAEFKWQEVKTRPRPPLSLSMAGQDWQACFNFENFVNCAQQWETSSNDDQGVRSSASYSPRTSLVHTNDLSTPSVQEWGNSDDDDQCVKSWTSYSPRTSLVHTNDPSTPSVETNGRALTYVWVGYDSSTESNTRCIARTESH